MRRAPGIRTQGQGDLPAKAASGRPLEDGMGKQCESEISLGTAVGGDCIRKVFQGELTLIDHTLAATIGGSVGVSLGRQ